MTLRFAYHRIGVGRSIASLQGRMVRPRPIVTVTILGPTGTAIENSLLDTGADDTVFPERVASTIGIDLSNAPQGTSGGIGGGTGLLRYASVTLRIADPTEQREWQAWVGFTTAKLRHSLLSFAGFLQYFTAAFHGDREEVELTVNAQYPGT